MTYCDRSHHEYITLKFRFKVFDLEGTKTSTELLFHLDQNTVETLHMDSDVHVPSLYDTCSKGYFCCLVPHGLSKDIRYHV